MYSYSKDGFVVLPGEERSMFKHGIAVQLDKTSGNAKMPRRAHPTDAGADLFSVENVVLLPGAKRLVDTGVAVKIPVGYGGFILNRSSQRNKLITSLGTGLIDSDYRGNIKVVIYNQSDAPYEITTDTAIAQLVIQKVELLDFVDIWNDTDRGANGFGSTGK